MPLYDMVKENRFVRFVIPVNTIEIEIPSLRDRMEDIPRLSQHFLKHYARNIKRALPAFQTEP